MRKLTKTRYRNGLNCDRRVWYDAHRPDLATPPDEATQRLFQQGNEVDAAAREWWPGGIKMPPYYRDPAAALRATRRAIEAGETLLYQASFAHEDVTVIVDILEKLKHGWHLVEVKMSTKVKDEHLEDIAIQKYVLEGAGLSVVRTSLVHLA